MTTRNYDTHRHTPIGTGRNGANPASPYGDPNGWVYGDGQYTYRMPIAARSFEFGDFAEESIRFYGKWVLIIAMIGGVFLLFGNAQVMVAMTKVMLWSTFVILPYLFVKTAHRFNIYELN